MTAPVRPASSVRYINCRWCTQRHTERYLCDPVAKMLEETEAQAGAGEAPAALTHTPVPLEAMTLAADDQVVGNLVVNGAVTVVGGVPRPTLVFTGRSLHGHTLPRWVYVCEDVEAEAVAVLVRSRVDMAVAEAQAQRGQL